MCQSRKNIGVDAGPAANQPLPKAGSQGEKSGETICLIGRGGPD